MLRVMGHARRGDPARTSRSTSSRRRTRTAPPGRDITTLLTDFDHAGHQVLRDDPEEQVAESRRLFPARRSGFRPAAGWVPPGDVPVSQWSMTSDQAPAFWPMIASPGPAPAGVPMGVEFLSGGTMFADPRGWVLDPASTVSNPNVWTIGKPGEGKSASVKAFTWRAMSFGYRAFILGDVKDEYESLVRAAGSEPVVLGPGMGNRLNPLDLGPLGAGLKDLPREVAQERVAIIFGRWISLLRGLVGAQKIGEHRVPVGPSEEGVLKAVLADLTGYVTGADTLTEVIIPQVWHALTNPSPDLIAATKYGSERQFLDETRLLRDALGVLIAGPAGGLIDGHTNIRLDWQAPACSLSLSRMRTAGDDVVGMMLMCLNSWGRAMREVAPAGDVRVVLRDESWRQLRLGPEAVAAFDADYRLSRTDGDIQWGVMHKPSDMLSVGDSGSMEAQIAKDMLHLADTKILHGQDPAVADELDRLLDLGPLIRGWVTTWCRQERGRAIWLVGDQVYKVQTVLTGPEKAMTDTNAALRRQDG